MSSSAPSSVILNPVWYGTFSLVYIFSENPSTFNEFFSNFMLNVSMLV